MLWTILPEASLTTLRQSYSLTQILLHWTIVGLCVIEFNSAEAIRRAHMGHVFGIPGTALDQTLAVAHEWGGWLLLFLVLLLIATRIVYGVPTLPSGMRAWQRWLAKGAHSAIYVALVALVASGATALYDGGQFATLHVTLTKVGIALIVIHAFAVMWHQIVRRDQLFWRMWPWRGF